jgi:SAM-dependent methyltransferase
MIRRLREVQPIVRFVQFAVTGEWLPRRHRLLARELERGPHGFVLDLGCGGAPMLRFVEPRRYVGVDEDPPALAAARAAHNRPDWQFVAGDLASEPLQQWRGADVAVLSSVTHHMDDAAVHGLLARVFAEVAPARVLVQDAEAIGPLGPVVRFLDKGRHLRRRSELRRLIEERYEVRELWLYDNPLRSFRQFLFEVRPARTKLSGRE